MARGLKGGEGRAERPVPPMIAIGIRSEVPFSGVGRAESDCMKCRRGRGDGTYQQRLRGGLTSCGEGGEQAGSYGAEIGRSIWRGGAEIFEGKREVRCLEHCESTMD